MEVEIGREQAVELLARLSRNELPDDHGRYGTDGPPRLARCLDLVVEGLTEALPPDGHPCGEARRVAERGSREHLPRRMPLGIESPVESSTTRAHRSGQRPDNDHAIGPAIVDGFFYDFETERPFTEDDLAAIEAKMQEIVDRNVPFNKTMVPRSQAIEDFKQRGDKFKVEILDGIEDEQVSIYKHGEFVDLCTGPHLPSTGHLHAFKLLSVAGAYWKGDASAQQLQRLYDTAWFSKQDLAAHIERAEEA